MLVLIFGCVIGVLLIELKVVISDDIEFEFKEYWYINDDWVVCEKSESYCFKNGVFVFGMEFFYLIFYLFVLEFWYKDIWY